MGNWEMGKGNTVFIDGDGNLLPTYFGWLPLENDINENDGVVQGIATLLGSVCCKMYYCRALWGELGASLEQSLSVLAVPFRISGSRQIIVLLSPAIIKG
jgi:hypothetical protein